MFDRCTREQQREKIVDLMNLRGQLEKMAKELNQEVAAKKNAGETCKKVFECSQMYRFFTSNLLNPQY